MLSLAPEKRSLPASQWASGRRRRDSGQQWGACLRPPAASLPLTSVSVCNLLLVQQRRPHLAVLARSGALPMCASTTSRPIQSIATFPVTCCTELHACTLTDELMTIVVNVIRAALAMRAFSFDAIRSSPLLLVGHRAPALDPAKIASSYIATGLLEKLEPCVWLALSVGTPANLAPTTPPGRTHTVNWMLLTFRDRGSQSIGRPRLMKHQQVPSKIHRAVSWCSSLPSALGQAQGLGDYILHPTGQL
ncbi:uncharacterized protein F5Z01DRAFT_418785 [Emericellopsis atlantica]|uniref:Uncharacterized protein n=1 Tax=Emericellopsis atlantica TaxID=2614577 RepID=A0A9P7ZE10_9HYPO|nr:uncharacterized protein F5Z01DRAFT_418785 [Emericellopsis atlantica]KAG9250211.1 hypothetical protein F5Z01DRAFT_418785 [Emericellopsis atlantica]